MQLFLRVARTRKRPIDRRPVSAVAIFSIAAAKFSPVGFLAAGDRLNIAWPGRAGRPVGGVQVYESTSVNTRPLLPLVLDLARSSNSPDATASNERMNMKPSLTSEHERSTPELISLGAWLCLERDYI